MVYLCSPGQRWSWNNPLHRDEGQKEWQELGQECSGEGRRQSHSRLCWDTGQPCSDCLGSNSGAHLWQNHSVLAVVGVLGEARSFSPFSLKIRSALKVGFLLLKSRYAEGHPAQVFLSLLVPLTTQHHWPDLTWPFYPPPIQSALPKRQSSIS